MHSSSFSIYNYIRVIVLYIEAEVGYVAVFHDIVLTFQANEAFSLAAFWLPQAMRSS